MSDDLWKLKNIIYEVDTAIKKSQACQMKFKTLDYIIYL